jgi:hypothetical protein
MNIPHWTSGQGYAVEDLCQLMVIEEWDFRSKYLGHTLPGSNLRLLRRGQ